MRIIFLDIDGVLATHWSITQPRATWSNQYMYPFDPVRVGHLNELINISSAEIVITSDWRLTFDTLEKLKGVFEHNKVVKSPIGITQDFSFDRDSEIEEYVSRHNLEEFVILDDLSLACFPHHFIFIEDGEIGITQKHFEKACKALEIPPFYNESKHHGLKKSKAREMQQFKEKWKTKSKRFL